MDERGRLPERRSTFQGGRAWILASVIVVLFLAMALWNTSLLDAGAHLSGRIGSLEHTLDSLEQVQRNQLARERLLAAEIDRLRSLEEDVRAKADAATVRSLRTRVDTLTHQAARLETEVRSRPVSSATSYLPYAAPLGESGIAAGHGHPATVGRPASSIRQVPQRAPRPVPRRESPAPPARSGVRPGRARPGPPGGR